MTTTLAPQWRKKLTDILDQATLSKGLGSRHNPCSLAAINLAITGELIDTIPSCMSRVIGTWIIPIQDSMPEEMRNSERWKTLLPLAASTGRDHELQRATMVMEWMWSKVLGELQHTADNIGFGKAWARMCHDRTPSKAISASNEALKWAKVDRDATESASSAAKHAHSALLAFPKSLGEVTFYAPQTTNYVGDATERASEAARHAPPATIWENFDPCGLLERLCQPPDPQ